MKIGYPCMNWTIKATPKTFRLASYSPEKVREVVAHNLDSLKRVLEYNVEHGFYFLRISSELVPFASHEIMDVDWAEEFKDTFSEIGNIIKKHNMKITMHPDQFVVLNSPKEAVVAKSIRELDYHVKVLDYLGLDSKAKLVLHVGGVYDDKKEAMKRFITNYKQLSQKIKDHLIIEHDDKLYSVKDCLYIHEQTGVPIVFDNFHHECLNNGEEEKKALEAVLKTWNPQKDGVPVTHYSSQNLNGPKGKHCDSIDIEHFKKYIENTKDLEFDIMLEIRDKEQSALETLSILHTIRKEMSVS